MNKEIRGLLESRRNGRRYFTGPWRLFPEEISRNRHRQPIEEEIVAVSRWLEQGLPFEAEQEVYIKRPAVTADHFPPGAELFSCVTHWLAYDNVAGDDTREHSGA